MRDFTTTRHCASGVHCNACRNDPAWRATMAKSFIMPETCPHITGLGDLVAKVLKAPGIRQAVRLVTGVDTRKPCGGCRKRQAWLNRVVPIANPLKNNL